MLIYFFLLRNSIILFTIHKFIWLNHKLFQLIGVLCHICCYCFDFQQQKQREQLSIKQNYLLTFFDIFVVHHKCKRFVYLLDAISNHTQTDFLFFFILSECGEKTFKMRKSIKRAWRGATQKFVKPQVTPPQRHTHNIVKYIAFVSQCHFGWCFLFNSLINKSIRSQFLTKHICLFESIFYASDTHTTAEWGRRTICEPHTSDTYTAIEERVHTLKTRNTTNLINRYLFIR